MEKIRIADLPLGQDEDVITLISRYERHRNPPVTSSSLEDADSTAETIRFVIANNLVSLISAENRGRLLRESYHSVAPGKTEGARFIDWLFKNFPFEEITPGNARYKGLYFHKSRLPDLVGIENEKKFRKFVMSVNKTWEKQQFGIFWEKTGDGRQFFSVRLTCKATGKSP